MVSTFPFKKKKKKKKPTAILSEAVLHPLDQFQRIWILPSIKNGIIFHLLFLFEISSRNILAYHVEVVHTFIKFIHKYDMVLILL